MIFKLTEDQINYIIEMYGGSKRLINSIQYKLNMLGVIEEENDYYEMVIAVVDRKQTINEQLKAVTTKKEYFDIFLNIDQIIAIELERKYDDFSKFKEESREKAKTFIQQKKRHN